MLMPQMRTYDTCASVEGFGSDASDERTYTAPTESHTRAQMPQLRTYNEALTADASDEDLDGAK